MSFQKFKADSYCAGQKHCSCTKNIVIEISFIKKTITENKMLLGKCVICDRKKSMMVSDNTIQAERLGSFSKNWERYLLKLAKT